MTTTPPGPRFRRSPYLLVGWDHQQLILTECDSLRRFRVDEHLLRVLSQLDTWQGADDLAASGTPVPDEALARLHRMGVVERSEPEPSYGHDERCFWSPAELAVQRSQGTGGERDAQHRQGPPPPAFKPRPEGAVTALPTARPLAGQLDQVLEARTSRRAYGPGPLPLGDVSALLHHSARVREVVEDPQLGQQVFRPYPGGGARSELELYLVANDVEGLAPGAHWYDSRAHDLVLIRPRDDGQDRVIQAAHDATGDLPRDPQAILLITAVFARIMWKYEGIGLGLIDRNVGCLYQTLYLVATALGLSPCALGGGPEAETARWLGLDPLVESQVGRFLIGTR